MMLCVLAVRCLLADMAVAAELARFHITEPLGMDWNGEWLTRDLDVGSATPDRLHLLGPDGASVPAQFRIEQGKLRVLFLASIQARQRAVFIVTDAAPAERGWRPLAIDGQKVSNGRYALDFSAHWPLLRIDGIDAAAAWPAGIEATGVNDDWIERGPARAILRRTFQFKKPAHRYEITFDMRAEDPWIGVTDRYALGRGSSIGWDLAGSKADKVYHPYAYNARTFLPGGSAEDSTLQPPQHPIATLGPIWRDIWYNGGPFAFVYNTSGQRGLGIVTVRGSLWQSPDDISLESQGLYVNGDKEKEGQVWVQIPTDGGERHWAIVPGHPDLRKRMPLLIRSHADIPLDRVLREWVLDWPSTAPVPKRPVGTFGYLGGNFNEHQKNPTTIPRAVKKAVRELMGGPVKSVDLAVLAYIFTNPDYWPGPKYRWKIGNPNFHTDMYPTPFMIGLLMPDHPRAGQWVEHGVWNIKHQIENDSFPGGSWKESIGYSGAFFAVAEYAAMAKRAGDVAGGVDPFRDWPRIKEIATWFACMETPVDPRYGARQKAPLGDTSPGSHVKQLNRLGEHFRGVDDTFAQQLIRFPQRWDGALDLSSREFFGFGAALRGNAYDERHESYVTMKAGPARNHYQGDELSIYFHALSTPLAIDHACHYSPRPWHAAMHNRPDMNDKRPVAIGVRRAFAASDAADVFVADERTREMNLVPLEPHNAVKPGWEYPTEMLSDRTPWTMRRFAMLVKHAPKQSKIPDYLVLRDEIDSPETVWWNLHVLGREIRPDGQRMVFPGQLDVDLTAHFLTPDVGEIQKRQWGWKAARSTWRKSLHGDEYEKLFFGGYLPEDFKRGTWGAAARARESQDPRDWADSGEMSQWLRVKAKAGRSDWLVVLMPTLKDRPAAKVERLSPTSARVALGDEAEVVHLGTDAKHQAAVERGGRLFELLKPDAVRPWAELPFAPIPATLDRGGR